MLLFFGSSRRILCSSTNNATQHLVVNLNICKAVVYFSIHVYMYSYVCLLLFMTSWNYKSNALLTYYLCMYKCIYTLIIGYHFRNSWLRGFVNQNPNPGIFFGRIDSLCHRKHIYNNLVPKCLQQLSSRIPEPADIFSSAWYRQNYGFGLPSRRSRSIPHHSPSATPPPPTMRSPS